MQREVALKFQRANFKYWIPFFGTRQLLKRIERLERELIDLRTSEDRQSLVLYYEARTEAIYDAICQRIKLNEPILDPERLEVRNR